MTFKPPIEKITTDLLIIGSEGAGCMAAVGAEKSGVSVLIVTKGQWGKSGATATGSADFSVDSHSLKEFGFKAANPDDSQETFMKDILKGGKYLNNQKLVQILVEEAPRRLRLLMEWGAHFTRIIHPSGHTYPRGVFFPGPNFVQVLKRRVNSLPKCRVLNNTVVLEIIQEGNAVRGALALDMEKGKFLLISCKAVILATGGGMGVYKHSTAPGDLTGDGYAIAARAGASLVDMEFPMFFPGVFAWPPALKKIDVPYHLSSAGRIFGHMYNKRGERFMSKWDPRLEHATRDIVSVAMYNEILLGWGSKHQGIYVSVKHLPDDLIDDIFAWDPVNSLHRFGFGKAFFEMKEYLPDIRRHSLEAVSACHFFNGGVRIDGRCSVDVDGLFAAGEVAGGIHGANRLSGNAFSEFLVFGRIAGENAGEYARQNSAGVVPQAAIEAAIEPYLRMLNRSGGANSFQIKEELQDLAWKKLGIIRTREGVEEGLNNIKRYQERIDGEMAVATKSLIMNQEFLTAVEVRNISQVLAMIGAAAKERPESRGAHYISENPRTDYSNWTRNIYLKNIRGKITLRVEPAVQGPIHPPDGILPYGKTEA